MPIGRAWPTPSELTDTEAVRHVPLHGRVDLRLTLSRLRHGFGDPTVRLEPDRAWRATRTPRGPAALALELHDGGVLAAAWGPGAGWALERVPELVGAADEPERLVARHLVVGRLQRAFPGLRIGRTGAVVEALIPAILEQKVTGEQARRAWRSLGIAHGDPAPGPVPLRLPPAAPALAALPYHAFHRFGVERRRAELIRAACARAGRLERLADADPVEAARVLRTFSGIGAWTAAEVTATALGDPDAVPVGDYHIPHLVAWALAGEPRGSDARMLELLEPYRGQRGRVIRLLEAGGARPPRFGPRLVPQRIERL